MSGARRAALLLIFGTALCLPLLPSTHPASAQAGIAETAAAAGAPQADDDAFPVEVLVDTLLPRVVRPHATVSVTGRLVNRGSEPLTDVRARLRLRTSAVVSRSELAALAVRSTPLGEPLSGTTTTAISALSPGGSTPFSVSVTADSLRLGGFGVYPFAVEAVASDTNGPNDVVGRVPTFLPWVPAGGGFRPTRLAWIWPFVDVPNRGATSDFPDDHLAGSLTSGGRLATLLGAAAPLSPTAPDFRQPATPQPPKPTTAAATPPPGRGTPTTPAPTAPRKPAAPAAETQRAVPVTYAVDPALLQAAADMADGYDVRPSGKRAEAGTGRAAATSWLTLLRQTLRAGPTGANAVFALPYADVDVSALARARLDPDITAAVVRGRQLAASVLGIQPLTSFAWPVGGFITTRALDDLAALDIRNVVLTESALPLTSSLPYTPDAGAKVDSAAGSVSARLLDRTLTRVVTEAERSALAAPPAEPSPASTSPQPTPTSTPTPVVPRDGTARIVEQRFLAETALITAEHPQDQRDIVVAPPRRWDPDPALAAALLADTGRVPWLQPIHLSQVRTGDAARTTLTYPDVAAAAELPASYLSGPGGVATLRRDLAVFRSILQPPVGPTAIALDYAALRTESLAWRHEDMGTGIALRDSVARELADRRDAVNISSGRRLITLASRRGRIPITISNDLDQSVVVKLQLTATNQARLSAPDTAPLTVAAGHKVTYELQAVVNQAGLFPVTVRLLTPQDPPQPYGPEVTFRLRSTAYGQLAVGITAGALGVLFLAVLVRLFRRARHARHDVAGDTGAT